MSFGHRLALLLVLSALSAAVLTIAGASNLMGPGVAAFAQEGDGACGGEDAAACDGDGDGVVDAADNCPAVANVEQANRDGDAAGNACDTDDDNDGVDDTTEASSGTDPLASDSDGDGALDGDDGCPMTSDPGQADTDGDTVGNACDLDDDNDGLDDSAEPALGTSPLVYDTDGDGRNDRDDLCPATSDPAQADSDGDGAGDACDPAAAEEEQAPDETPRVGTRPSPTPGTPSDGPGVGLPAAQTSAPVSPATAPFVPTAPGRATLPPPVLGRAVALTDATGTVTFRRPGSDTAVPLDGQAQIPVGAIVDVTAGSVVLTSARPGGRVQHARFSGGRFRIRQRVAARGLTELVLAGDPPSCRARAAARGGRKSRSRLWGDGKGRFTTHGRSAAATVRGTKWLVEETCRGTLVRVARGVVDVRDKRLKRTVTLGRGDRYVARR